MAKHEHGHQSKEETHMTSDAPADSGTTTTSTDVSTATASPIVPATPAVASPAAAAAGSSDERYKRFVLDDAGSIFAYGHTQNSGKTVNRIDFIRSAWTTQQKARGAIAKECSRLQNEKVTYQIVFSATKDVAGGPPVASAVAPAAPVVPATPATQQS